jgi:hypothetical protein
MEKIEYSDLYKFFVSIGLVLIAIFFLTWYVFLKEDFGLYIEQEKFVKFSEPIQQLITAKQNRIIELQKWDWVTYLLLIIGLLSTGFGIFIWWKRQIKVDEKFENESLMVKLKLRSMTLEERVEKAEQEVISVTTTTTTTPEIVENYMDSEERLIQMFLQSNQNEYEILSNQILGNQFEIDLIAKAKNKMFSDKIIEIKYITNLVPFSFIDLTIKHLKRITDFYISIEGNDATPILLIVHTDDVDIDNINYFDEKINKGKVTLRIVNEKDFNVNDFLKNLDRHELRGKLLKSYLG